MYIYHSTVFPRDKYVQRHHRKCPVQKSIRISKPHYQLQHPAMEPLPVYFAFSFSFFLKPLVLRGRPLADLLDFKLVEEPILRTFLVAAAMVTSGTVSPAAASSLF
jgi:hypothetical protein